MGTTTWVVVKCLRFMCWALMCGDVAILCIRLWLACSGRVQMFDRDPAHVGRSVFVEVAGMVAAAVVLLLTRDGRS